MTESIFASSDVKAFAILVPGILCLALIISGCCRKYKMVHEGYHQEMEPINQYISIPIWKKPSHGGDY